MFQPTKPFKDTITDHPQQPSLRIGRVVPKEAVNLAYYYNPTATDAEKILTAEAPRNTIDHRVEQAYRYLFDQASKDDDLFPGFVTYEDEEGYSGKLGRMYVQWYPETHVLTKHIMDVTQSVIVTDKANVPKTQDYSDEEGFKGTLYLDVSTVEATKYKDDTTTEKVDRRVRNFELSYREIFGSGIPQGPSNAVDLWMLSPEEDSAAPWPIQIEVGVNGCAALGCLDPTVESYVNALENSLDGAVGVLDFIRTEYEQIPLSSTSDGTTTGTTGSIDFGNSKFRTKLVSYNGDLSAGTEAANQFARDELAKADLLFKEFYGAEYDASTNTYVYDKVPANLSDPSVGVDPYKSQRSGSIEEFLNTIVKQYCTNQSASFIQEIKNAMKDGNKDIAIYRTSLYHVVTEQSSLQSSMYFEATYECKISSGLSGESGYAYNVIAVYGGQLQKTITHNIQIATEYKAECHYSGIARKTWETYDGMAYYRGSVTKGNGVGNMNPEDDNEILMYPDINGYLRRPVYRTDQEGNVTLRNFYKIETDYAYLTDVFKNGTACFWKYDLKAPLYDYRGPDARGFYEGNALKLFTSSLKDLPSGYEYNMKLIPAEYETVTQLTSGFATQLVQRPMRYHAELFTSFLSTASDTYKVTYNAFDDNDKDNVALNNGVTEEIYNYPFLLQNKDFTIESINKAERTSRIKMGGDYEYYIEDTRRYINITFRVFAERKQQYGKGEDGESQTIIKPAKQISSNPITVSILNRDYALPAEYVKFDGRGMIVSPQSDGFYLSPFDIILKSQAEKQEAEITSKDTDFYFYAVLEECNSEFVGGINLKCNPDGSGYITAETTIDTGFWDDTRKTWTKKLNINNPYFIEQCSTTETDDDGIEHNVNKIYIFPGIKVKCIDARHIKVLAPREEGLLDSWYPRIQFGHYSQILDQYGTHTKVCYSMPEYDTQHFSAQYLAPYVDVKQEQVEILNPYMVRTKCFPLYHTKDFQKPESSPIRLFKRVLGSLYDIDIKDISFTEGIIITNTAISENDDIVCDYTYLEESYVYRGFWKSAQDFARIDLNPNIYHTYSNLSYDPTITKPTKDLFNKVIYFFLKPSLIFEVTSQSKDDLIFDFDDPEYGANDITKIAENTECLYHKIDDDTPDDDWDIYIGSVYIRSITSLHSTVIVDGRTRGGGLIESMKDSIRKQLEPESDYYLDIGFYDGEPYQENGVIIIRLDQRLLKDFGGRFTKGDIEVKVKRWLGLGVYPIIEYVDTYTKRDLPQHSLIVDDSYGNVVDIVPEIYLEYRASL